MPATEPSPSIWSVDALFAYLTRCLAEVAERQTREETLNTKRAQDAIDLVAASATVLRDQIEVQRDMRNSSIAALDRLLAEKDQSAKENFASADRALRAALDASERAINKAEIAQEKRNEILNGARGETREIVSRLMPRAEADASFQQLRDAIADNKKEIATIREQIVALASRQQNDDRRQDVGHGQLQLLLATTLGFAGTAIALLSLLLNHH